MIGCIVQIVEIIDDSFYPGMCRAVIEGVYGKKHVILDKPPIFGFDLEKAGKPPFEGSIRCELVQELGDQVVIDTENPDHIESEEGDHVFTISKSHVSIRQNHC